jgi:hypothetical protein
MSNLSYRPYQTLEVQSNNAYISPFAATNTINNAQIRTRITPEEPVPKTVPSFFDPNLPIALGGDKPSPLERKQQYSTTYGPTTNKYVGLGDYGAGYFGTPAYSKYSRP